VLAAYHGSTGGPPASHIRRRSPTARRRVHVSLPLAVSNHCLIKTIRRRCHASSCRNRCYQLSAVIRERARPTRDADSRGGCGRESAVQRRAALTTPVVGPESRPRNASTLRPLRGTALRRPFDLYSRLFLVTERGDVSSCPASISASELMQASVASVDSRLCPGL